MALPAARALCSYAHKALGSWPVSAPIPNAIAGTRIKQIYQIFSDFFILNYQLFLRLQIKIQKNLINPKNPGSDNSLSPRPKSKNLSDTEHFLKIKIT